MYEIVVATDAPYRPPPLGTLTFQSESTGVTGR
jgi:hypothetical protein